MMDEGEWLSLEGLEFQCVIGVTERERGAPQQVTANVAVQVDFAKAARSDAIDDTVDYRRIADRVLAAGAASRFHLVEALAVHLADTVLEAFPPVRAVRIEIEKARALARARAVKAIVVRRR